MATKAPAKAAAPAAKNTKTINRKKRNSLERKSLPKAIKRLFAGSDRTTFRTLLAAWKEARRKAPREA